MFASTFNHRIRQQWIQRTRQHSIKRMHQHIHHPIQSSAFTNIQSNDCISIHWLTNGIVQQLNNWSLLFDCGLSVYCLNRLCTRKWSKYLRVTRNWITNRVTSGISRADLKNLSSPDNHTNIISQEFWTLLPKLLQYDVSNHWSSRF